MTEVHTERSMLDQLHLRYGNGAYLKRGNGVRWVVAEHVRNDSGFWAARTADFMAVDMFPSTGNAIHGHEVKVSRSDWLSELKKPEKAEVFLDLVDYWWLVVSDAKIVKDGELPHGWGLMALSPGGLRVRKKALALRTVRGSSLDDHRAAQPVPRGFATSLMRAVMKTAQVQAIGGGLVHGLDYKELRCRCGFTPRADEPGRLLSLHMCQANRVCDRSGCWQRCQREVP